MQKSNRHILSTRPLPEAVRQKAAAQNVCLDCISFINTKTVLDAAMTAHIRQLFQKPITAVFTSMNAVTAVAEVGRAEAEWKVYSIGHATAETVAQLFQIPITGTAPNAAILAEVVINDGVKEVYFFCGKQRRDELPHKLMHANIAVHELVVYETIETPVVVEKEYDAVLYYSPSAVHSFFTLNKVPAATVVFAIGATTANAVKQYTANQIFIAAKPDKEALVEQALEYVNTLKGETK